MNTVLITGGTGLVGSRLSILLKEKGYSVRHLSRNGDLDATFPKYKWDIDKQYIEEGAFDGVDTIIHLAGAGIADKRWSNQRKKTIIDSRVNSTILLARYIDQLATPPQHFIAASAVGIYGETGDNLVTESSSTGKGFLSDTTLQWEQSTYGLTELTKVPTSILRIGIVLSTLGGALEKMILPFKFGVGNTLGNGQQYYSWIHIDDLCRQFIFLAEKKLTGTYNGVGVEAATNKEITQSIGEVMSRKIILPAPAFALKVALGEMADMVLMSTRVSSQKIQDAGFTFEHMALKPAIKDLITNKK